MEYSRTGLSTLLAEKGRAPRAAASESVNDVRCFPIKFLLLMRAMQCEKAGRDGFIVSWKAVRIGSGRKQKSVSE